jgi:hypothetical protein
MYDFTAQRIVDRGLNSYRYLSSYRWIMIEAKNPDEALSEVRKHLSPRKKASIDRLYIWDGKKYILVKDN